MYFKTVARTKRVATVFTGKAKLQPGKFQEARKRNQLVRVISISKAQSHMLESPRVADEKLKKALT